MSDFEPGDKVRCIDATDVHGPTGEILEEGKVYEVTEVGDSYIKELDGELRYSSPHIGFGTGRFEKVEEPKFEVGDRVRIVADGEKFGFIIGVGSEGVIEDIKIDDRYPIKIRFDQGRQVATKDQIELISKGEDTMQDVDAIAVEVDDTATLDYLKKLAKENDFKIAPNAEGSDSGVYGFTQTTKNYADRKSFYCIDYGSFDSCESHLGKYDYRKIDLDSELGKLKNFLEQEVEQLELCGEPVEVNHDSGSHFPDFKIGCYEESIGSLFKLTKALDELNIVDGEFEVTSGETVTYDDVQELLDYVGGN